MVYIALIVVQILFGLNVMASRVVIGDLHPVYWSFLRFSFSAFILFVICLFTRRQRYEFSSQDILFKLFPLSFIGYVLAPNLFMLGLQYTSAIHAAIISTTIPLMTLSLSLVFGDEKPNIYKIFGFLSAFFGIYTLHHGSPVFIGDDQLLGDLLILIGCFCVAAHMVLTKKFITTKDHVWTTVLMLALGILGTGAVILLLFTSVPMVKSGISSASLLWGVFAIIGGTVLAYLLNNWALKRIHSSDVSLYVYLQPVVVAIVGYFVWDKPITPQLITSSLLVFSGLVLSYVISSKFATKPLS